MPHRWAHHTKSIKALPEHVADKKKKRRAKKACEQLLGYMRKTAGPAHSPWLRRIALGLLGLGGTLGTVGLLSQFKKPPAPPGPPGPEGPPTGGTGGVASPLPPRRRLLQRPTGPDGSSLPELPQQPAPLRAPGAKTPLEAPPPPGPFAERLPPPRVAGNRLLKTPAPGSPDGTSLPETRQQPPPHWTPGQEDEPSLWERFKDWGPLGQGLALGGAGLGAYGLYRLLSGAFSPATAPRRRRRRRNPYEFQALHDMEDEEAEKVSADRFPAALIVNSYLGRLKRSAGQTKQAQLGRLQGALWGGQSLDGALRSSCPTLSAGRRQKVAVDLARQAWQHARHCTKALLPS